MSISDKIILSKDEYSETVRMADYTPHRAYNTLTEAVEDELATNGESLSDATYRDGQTLGKAIVTEDGEVLSLSLS